MKHIQLFERFKENFEKFKEEERTEVNKISNLYFNKRKKLTNSYLVLINEAGQELIDDWSATSSFDHTLNQFLFKIELEKVSKKDVENIFKLLLKFEKKASEEFTVKYRFVADVGYDVHYRCDSILNVDLTTTRHIERANKTLIQVWLS
jgi:hypothetical protein